MPPPWREEDGCGRYILSFFDVCPHVCARLPEALGRHVLSLRLYYHNIIRGMLVHNHTVLVFFHSLSCQVCTLSWFGLWLITCSKLESSSNAHNLHTLGLFRLQQKIICIIINGSGSFHYVKQSHFVATQSFTFALFQRLLFLFVWL